MGIQSKISKDGGVWGTLITCEIPGQGVIEYVVTVNKSPSPAAIGISYQVGPDTRQTVIIPLKDWPSFVKAVNELSVRVEELP